MTEYVWDASHYDGQLSTGILARARAEGIGAFTHKIGEGTNYDDPNDLTALAAARDAGFENIGGYFVVRSEDVVAQVRYAVSLADRDEPWWRDFPGWSWQTDLERWSYDNVAAPLGVEFSKRLRDQTGRQVLLYASHGQYGDQLGGWDGPLWNADYTGNPAGGFKQMYPGDDWAPSHGGWTGGWAPYSGKKRPALLQYTSSADIAGLTTCDASGFVGSFQQLKDLFRGGTKMPDYGNLKDPKNFGYGPDVADIDVWAVLHGGKTTGWSDTDGEGWWVFKELDGAAGKLDQGLKKLDQILKALAGGLPPMTVDQINALGDKIGEHLILATDNPLGDKDMPAIKAAVKQALREGTVTP